MKQITYISFLFLAVLLSGCSSEKKNPAWVINEVMVVNETNYVDDFGQRNGWIEIYNNTAATKDLGGRYLTNDRNNPKKYPIPRGDVLTRIPPHQHVLFWADDEPFNGTFHVNFKLDPTQDNYIALYENDGKTLLDEIVIPAGMLTDQTYGYPNDGIKYDKEGKYMKNSESNSLEKSTITRKSDRQLWLSVSESAKLAGVDGKTIRRAIKSKKLKYKVSGNRYAIRLHSLIEFSHDNAKLRNKFYTQGLGQYVDKFKKNIVTK